MDSKVGFTTSMMFRSISDDLNASLATADELSREFSSLLQECSPVVDSNGQANLVFSEERSLKAPETSYSATSSSQSQYPSGSQSQYSSSSQSQYAPSSLSQYSASSQSQYNPDSQFQYTSSSQSQYAPISSSRSLDLNSPYSTPSTISSSRSLDLNSPYSTPPPISNSRSVDPSSPYVTPSPGFTPNRLSLPRGGFHPHNWSNSSFSSDQLSLPNQLPKSQRQASPTRNPGYSSGPIQSPCGSSSYGDWTPPLVPNVPPPRNTLHRTPGAMPSFEGGQRRDRSPSPSLFSPVTSSTLPRNFMSTRAADDTVPKQKSPAHWNETDLDVSFERKPHHTYDKSEWHRPSVPNSTWRESNLDASPPVSKKLPASYGSLPRGTCPLVTPDRPSPLLVPCGSLTYNPQPIISRISIPPAVTQPRRNRPIPLSIIMRLQYPNYAMANTRYPRGEEVSGKYQALLPLLQDYVLHPAAPEQKQPENYGEVLSPGDVDAELERLDPMKTRILQDGSASEKGGVPETVPRPLSPTRLQSVLAPESMEISELRRIFSEVPRALRRRGSDQASPQEKVPSQPASQYKQMITKFLRKKGDQQAHQKGELESDSNSSSEAEDSVTPPPPPVAPVTPTQDLPEQKGLNSILRQCNRECKTSRRRARLSPLVLLLDGALVGELETVQKALQEMSDPSQPNDEGITALHNAICGGHYNVVEFLVRNGANVSAPDSHGWTPLHCAASCNDLPLCEFLVRNGAAVMAVTESDGATASQKCDPFAPGFEECEGFLRGVEEAMGVENSGVLYALWNYPAQNLDELSFREGDMVTILQKPERGDWWWASLCGREGFVPNNYFGLFPKVRTKSLC